MANKALAFYLAEKTQNFGKLAGKKVQQAIPTDRQRVTFRELSEEVARNTTFAPEEVQAVINLMTKIAKHHVENGESVELGDLGTLTPSFRSKVVEVGKEAFSVASHITRPTVRLNPSRKYFELRGVSFERVERPAKSIKFVTKPKDGSGAGSSSGSGSSGGTGSGDF